MISVSRGSTGTAYAAPVQGERQGTQTAETASPSKPIEVVVADLCKQSRFDDAESLLMAERLGLGDRSSFIELLLTDVNRRKGNYHKALRFLKLAQRDILAAPNKLPRSTRLSTFHNYAALLYNNMGRYAQSEFHARKALELAKEVGADECVLAMNSVVLANALRQQSKFANAARILEPAVNTLQAHKDCDKALLGTAINNLGALHFWMGDFAKAKSVLLDGLAIREAATDKEHPDVANSLLDLGCTEFKLGQIEVATKHLKRSLDIRRSKLGNSHPDTLASMAALAVALETDGKHEMAGNLLAHVSLISPKVLGKNHPDSIGYLDSYAQVLTSQGSFKRALALQARANVVRRTIYSRTGKEVATGLFLRAKIESSAGKNSKAGKLLQQCVKLFASCCGEQTDSNYADALEDLATYYAGTDQPELARVTLSRAIDVKPSSAPQIGSAIMWANYADLSERLGDEKQARRGLLKAKAIIDTLQKCEQAEPECVQIMERCKKLLADD